VDELTRIQLDYGFLSLEETIRFILAEYIKKKELILFAEFVGYALAKVIAEANDRLNQFIDSLIIVKNDECSENE
jgi:hypothetical protein